MYDIGIIYIKYGHYYVKGCNIQFPSYKEALEYIRENKIGTHCWVPKSASNLWTNKEGCKNSVQGGDENVKGNIYIQG